MSPANNYQRKTNNEKPTTTNEKPTTKNEKPSADNHQQSTINHVVLHTCRAFYSLISRMLTPKLTFKSSKVILPLLLIEAIFRVVLVVLNVAVAKRAMAA